MNQATRTIKVLSTETDNLKTIQSSASTWGELKAELQGSPHNMNVSNMKAMIKEGTTENPGPMNKVTLEQDGASLPSGEFTIFTVPARVKSGY